MVESHSYIMAKLWIHSHSKKNKNKQKQKQKQEQTTPTPTKTLGKNLEETAHVYCSATKINL